MAARKPKRRSSLEVARDRAERERLACEAMAYKLRRESLERAYEGATAGNYHPRRKETRSGDAVMQHANTRLRSIARYLDENHDLAIGVLDDLVNKIIGTGIGIDPIVRRQDGTPAADLNAAIAAGLSAWTEARPDSTRQYPWGDLQRLCCRTWLRDGELLVHHVEGEGRIRHRGPIPYSLELLEPDFLPFDLFRDTQGQNRIVHGVELNGWREPVGYWLYFDHPGDFHAGRLGLSTDTKRVAADQLTHIRLVRRLHQTRGVTVFHGVLTRLEDIKEYDDSERIAARVASAFTAVITRSADYQGPYTEDAINGATRRVMEMAPGMIFDNLMPGEAVDTISSDRPNAQYDAFRKANERAVAAGTGTSRSSISKDYIGNYSSQRQELVESEVLYAKARDYFVSMFHREIYRRVVDWLVITGQVRLPADIDRASLYAAAFTPPGSSWIDPLKEVKADREAVEAGFTSRQAVIRKRGGNPTEVDQQIAQDNYQVPALPAPAAAATDPEDSANQEAA